MSKLKEYIQKIIEDDNELNEEGSVSGDAGPYSTPFAFRGTKKMRDSIKESVDKIINEELLSEVSFNKFKNEVSLRTKSEVLNKAVREVKKKLSEINNIVDYTSRMKQELSENEEGIKYWKSTLNNLNTISEMVENLNTKIKDLH